MGEREERERERRLCVGETALRDLKDTLE